MIIINLLPESHYKAKRRAKIVFAAISAVIVALSGLALLYIAATAQILDLNLKIKKVEDSKKQYEKVLAEIDNISKTKAFLSERLKSLTDLTDSQVMWTIILDDFNRCIPNNLWLNSLTNKLEAGGFRTFTVEGVALYKEVVADFITNLNKANFLRKASLSNLTSTSVAGANTYSFKIVFQSMEDTKIRPPKPPEIKDISKTGIIGSTYINKEYECSISKPDNWTIKDVAPLPNMLAILEKVKRVMDGKYTPTVTLSVEEMDKPIALKDYIASAEAAYRKDFKGFQKISQKEVVINAQKCFELVFSRDERSKTTKEDVQLQQKQVFYAKNNRFYVLTCTDVASNYSKNVLEFDVIINTFKIQ